MKYLIATYYKKPNGKFDEVIELKSSVKTKHWQTAKLILNLTEKKVEKQTLMDESASYDRLYQYYYKINQARIDKFLAE
jgi:hypothetical protein